MRGMVCRRRVRESLSSCSSKSMAGETFPDDSTWWFRSGRVRRPSPRAVEPPLPHKKPKGYLRDTQGIPKGPTGSQYRSNTGATRYLLRGRAVSAPRVQDTFLKAAQADGYRRAGCPEGMTRISLLRGSKGTSACPPSGSLKRRTWVPGPSAMLKDRDRVEVVSGVTSTKNSTTR